MRNLYLSELTYFSFRNSGIMKHLLTLVFTVITAVCYGQFTVDTLQNTVIHDINGSEQATPLSGTTSNGSTYVSWFDLSSGSYVLRMQLLDANGNNLWAAGGIVVSSYPQSTALFRYDLKVDNDDNAIVAFQDMRSGTLNVVAYKVNTTGGLVWGNAGVALSDSTAEGLGPKITITQNNNVIVAWNSSIGTSKWVSYQKINSSGAIVWAKRILDSNKYSRPVLLPYGSDDFLMLYVKEVGSFPGVTSTMYAQRYDSNGNGVWLSPTQVSTKTISFFTFPDIISDTHNGFYISFNTSNPVNTSLNDVYAQHVDSTGALWSNTGTQAANSTTEHKLTGGCCYSAANNELYLSLQVLDGSQGSSGIYLQKLDNNGSVLLGPNALLLRPIISNYYLPYTITDAGNGVIILYGLGTFGNQKIQALKTDYSGGALWSYDPTLCNYLSNKDDLSSGRFTNNQTVAVWSDDRLDNGIYTQNISGDGDFGILTSIQEDFLEQTMMLFPNPGLHPSLQLTTTSSTTLSITVYNLIGKKISSENFVATAGNNVVPIPDPGTDGLYFIEVSGNKKSNVVKWIRRGSTHSE